MKLFIGMINLITTGSNYVTSEILTVYCSGELMETEKTER